MKRGIPIAAVVGLLCSLLVVSAAPIGGGGGLAKVTHGSAMFGSGTTAAPLDLTHSCSAGQVLVWSGSAWGCTGNVALSAALQAGSDVSSNGAFINGGTAPTLSSCGTSPTATKGPQIFTITVGTGTATTCTATFANAPLAAVPTCTVQSETSTLLNVYLSAKSASAITISNAGGANMAGIALDVVCVGH
jgi:hypothetical protein